MSYGTIQTLYRFHIKTLSSLARHRPVNVLAVRLRRLYPRRFDIIFDLEPELLMKK